MPMKAAPRSVSDATRFTPNTPHATSKASAGTESGASAVASRFARSGNASSSASLPGGSNGGGPPRGKPGSLPSSMETPDERVARLRAAHQRAKNAKVSGLDKIIAGGRRVFDTAHKVTIMGLIGFTVLMTMATVYTATDMMMHNKKRRTEFLEAQKQMAANSLEAARLAYMTGKATEDQVALVEEANARDAGIHQPILKMPSILGAPTPISGSESTGAKPSVSEAASWPSSAGASDETTPAEKKSGGLRGWLFAGLKNQEEGEDVGSSQKRLGWESLSEEDDGTGLRDSDLVRAVEDKQAVIRDKARAAFEKEKENQRNGGPLDRIGIEGGNNTAQQPRKKGWFW